MYANTDGINPREFNIPYEERDEIDKWLLSKYNNLLKSVVEDMAVFDYTKVVRNIQNFVIEDFSNWYIRRNRRRFWKTEIDNDKKAVYRTSYEVLLGLTKMIAPIVPFISEELYKSLEDGESVHLESYPVVNESQIDERLEEKMDLVRNLVALGRASREAVKIKVRQPIKEVIIDGKYQEIIGDLTDLIKEELNVKEVVFGEDLSVFMNYELKPNFKVAGSILGPKVKAFGKALKEVEPKAFVEELKEGTTLELNGEETEIKEDYVLVNISAKEGFDVCMENNLFVILDTELDAELIAEGLVREFISKVQQLRKAADFDVLDNINIEIEADEEINSAIKNAIDFVKEEVLAKEIVFASVDSEVIDLNGHEAKIKVERV